MRVNLTRYALDNITDAWQFEELCSDLLFREGFKHLKPHGRMHDHGIDALIHVYEVNPRIIFQYSTQKAVAAKIKGTLLSLRENGEQCDELHYVSNREIPYSTVKELADFARNEYGTRLEIYDREWIRLRLDNDSSDLRKKYLGVEAEQEYSVDYKAYWKRESNGALCLVIEIFWLDESDVQVLKTSITATPSNQLLTRFEQLNAKGFYTLPTLLLLQYIASICQYNVTSQAIDDEPVTNKIEIKDSSRSGRDFSLEIETSRLIEMPNSTTIVSLGTYVPGVCDALCEIFDKEMTIEERTAYGKVAQDNGVRGGSIKGKRMIRASDLKFDPTALVWKADMDDSLGSNIS